MLSESEDQDVFLLEICFANSSQIDQWGIALAQTSGAISILQHEYLCGSRMNEEKVSTLFHPWPDPNRNGATVSTHPG